MHALHQNRNTSTFQLTFKSQSHLFGILRRQLLQSSERISRQSQSIQHVKLRRNSDIGHELRDCILVGVRLIDLGCTNGMASRGKDLANLNESLVDGIVELVLVESPGRWRGVERCWCSHDGDNMD